MHKYDRVGKVAFAAITLFCTSAALAQQPEYPPPKEGDYISHDFHFESGETLPELRLHYSTFGAPVRDAKGRVTNAVMLLH